MITLELDDNTAIRLLNQLSKQIGKALEANDGLSVAAPTARATRDEESRPRKRKVMNVDHVGEEVILTIKKRFTTADFIRKSGVSASAASRFLGEACDKGMIEKLGRGDYRILGNVARAA